MKKFLLYVALFCVPIILLLVGLELAVHTIPNSYSYKYNYVKEKGGTIKIVAIGHSQFFNDFNTSDFYLPAFNLSNSAQGYMEDYYIMRELLPYMPNLEMVLLPIGYMNIGREEEFTQKSCYYHEYMNIDYDGQIPLSNRYECFYVRSTIKKILSYYYFHDDIIQCDSLGWRPKFISTRSAPLGHDRVIDIYTLKQGQDFFLAGEKYLKDLVSMLEEKKIQIVLVSPPYYWQCTDNINYEQMKWSNNYIDDFCKQHPNIIYINFETEHNFEEKDFFDESHLSEVGARKFTRIINNILNN